MKMSAPYNWIDFSRSTPLKILSFCSRVFIGIVFIFYSLDKIQDPYVFAKSIAAYQLLPNLLVSPLALVLPWLELFCGMALLLGFKQKSAALLASAMVVMFLAALAWAVIWKLNISCGCSSLEEPIGVKKFAEDFLYLGASLLVFFVPTNFLSIDTISAPVHSENAMITSATNNSNLPLE